MIGRTLSHYRIVDEISRGGMGVVYRAVDVRLNREVALKVLPPELVSDADRKRRFVQEAQAASALEHPHIAVIHEIDEAEGLTFIAMELVRGEKLSETLARDRLSVARSIELASEVAEGLARAHDKGIVHRDLKPANIMVTDEGHAKIIDFGLAKLVEPEGGYFSGAETRPQQAETDPGVVLGTVSYMSPEQARGAKVDHRTDIFAFGIVLHEMLTGQPPFQGRSGLDTLHAILTDAPPRLAAAGSAVPLAAQGELQRIADKCLAKEPSDRYQGMRDLVVDLRGARRLLESGSIVAPAGVGRLERGAAAAGVWWRRPAVLIGGGLALAAVVAAGMLLVRRSTPSAPAAAVGSKPSVAVLYFENTTGNQSLDWLRTGLTDMLVTDLSQSPDVEVLSTDRLHQILSELRRQDDRVISSDVVQQVAERAGVTTVLLGSYVKAGEAIRINVRLQDARSGKVLGSERVEGMGESNLFTMVDDLTRRIKAKFALPGAADGQPPTLLTQISSPTSGVDRDLKEVTTASIEAYRYYAEGINLHERFREAEAVPLFERAIAIDPNFAMAYVKLAIVHVNLGHQQESDKYSELALKHIDRLSTRERYYIEGVRYSNRLSTLARAIDAYSKGFELYPDHASARHNLGLILIQVGRPRDSIGHYEELRRRGMMFPATHGNLAFAYDSLGDPEKAYQVMVDFLRRSPDSAAGHDLLGAVLVTAGRLDEALAAYRKAESLEPATSRHALQRWAVHVLRGEWAEADSATQAGTTSQDTAERRSANAQLAVRRLYQGRTAEALGFLDKAVQAIGGRGPGTFRPRLIAAQILLERGQSVQAAAEAGRAAADAEDRPPQGEALTTLAIAQMRAGRRAEADATAEQLRRIGERLPGPRERIRHRYLVGELALVRGDAATAVRELTQAQGDLLPRAMWFYPGVPPQPHVPIWFALASAYLAAGNDAEAARYFQTIADSTSERLLWPMPYVRSFYFLGKIAEKRGDMAKAREHYRRFLDHWQDGDLDRERVAEALSKTRER